MRLEEKQGGNRWFVVLLCFFVMLIVVLATSLVVTINTNNTPVDDLSDKQAEAELRQYVEDANEYYTTRDKVSAMIENGTVTPEKIISTYSKYVDSRDTTSGAVGPINSYIIAEYEDLMRCGFRQEALNTLTSIDFSFLTETEQHMWYMRITDLAIELGDTSVVQSYEPLLQATQAAYDASVTASEKTASKYEALEQKGRVDEE